MTTGTRLTFSLMLLALLAAPSAGAVADPQDQLEPEVAEQEGAMYGRLRYLEGSLKVRRADEVLTDLIVNDPIAPGDAVSTGPDGRAEIQLADGSVVRVDHDSELILQSLPDGTGRLEDTTILQLPRGSILVRAETMESGDKRFQIDTDITTAFLLSEGTFRVDAQPGVTFVRSRRGAVEVTSRDASTMVRSGERVAVRAGEMPGEAHAMNTRTGDDFDAWAEQRDNAFVRTVEADEQEPEALPAPVSPYANELSYYGSWQNTPSYGWMWRPSGVAPTWQPYVNGRWAWSPAGMVWVSYEPWGWAPYHYGRWEYFGGGWGWIPGYAYAGAHVAWNVSPGYFGWCPLGYYNYPVSFGISFGFHRNPWCFVRANHIYSRHVHTVVVRDPVIVRGLHQRGVVVRGHPRISPRHVRSAPAVSEELHRTASRRPDLQVRQPSDSDRRTPFRETERQRLAQTAPRSGSVRGVQGRVPSPRGASRVSDPTVSTPRVPTMQPARPTYIRNQEWRRQGTPVDTTPIRQDPRRSPGSQTPQRMESRPNSSQPPVAQPRSVRTPETQPPGSRVRGMAPSSGSRVTRPAPSQRQVQPDPRRGSSASAPERVIPRMIPRSRAESVRTAPPASVRQPTSRPSPAQARPSSAPGRPSPAQARPSSAPGRPSPAQARPSASSRSSSPGRASSSGGVRGHGAGGGKPKGGKGDRD